MASIKSFTDGFVNTINSIQDAVNESTPLNQNDFNGNDGFTVKGTPIGDGEGLPFTKVTSHKSARRKRNLIHWFVPDFGVLKMYVNPSSISYNYKKIINQTQTKGGFSLQYWGEDLPVLSIRGTTGSSGVEGINMLYEIYRAEQYSFDNAGLLIGAGNSNAASLTTGLLDSLSGALGIDNVLGEGGLSGILGAGSSVNPLSAKNIPTLAQNAFTVEMFYNGWVFRGFFKSMTIEESADNFFFNYSLEFVVTQKRGYRVNSRPWEKNPIGGESDINSSYSFNGKVL